MQNVNTLISLLNALVSVGSLFGLFYKMKYQLEALEKKTDKIADNIENAIEASQENKIEIEKIKVKQLEMEKDINELKGVKNERGQIDIRTS